MIKRHKVVIPFPNPRPGKDIKYKFAYEKPSYLNVVGSFAMRTMVRETDNSNVDFVLQMPSVRTTYTHQLRSNWANVLYRPYSRRRTTLIIATFTSELTI